MDDRDKGEDAAAAPVSTAGAESSGGVRYPVQRRPTDLQPDPTEVPAASGTATNLGQNGSRWRARGTELAALPGMRWALGGGLLFGVVLGLLVFGGGPGPAPAADTAGPAPAPAAELDRPAPAETAALPEVSPDPGESGLRDLEPAEPARPEPEPESQPDTPAEPVARVTEGAPGPDDGSPEDTGTAPVASPATGQGGSQNDGPPAGGPSANQQPEPPAVRSPASARPGSDSLLPSGPVTVTLVFSVEPAEVDGLTIAVNGERVDGTSHTMDVSGPIEVVARARGFRTWKRRMTPRTNRTVSIKLRRPVKKGGPGGSIDL